MSENAGRDEMRKLTENEMIHAVEAGQELWRVMSRLNSTDIYPLVVDMPDDPDAVYHHLDQAMRALFRLMDMDPDKAMADLADSYDVHSTVVRLSGVMV